MAGGNNFCPQSDDSHSSGEGSPVFAVSEKDRKNSLLKVLAEESKEQRRTSFADMAIQQLSLEAEPVKQIKTQLIDGDDPLF